MGPTYTFCNVFRPIPESVTTGQPIYLVASRRGRLRPEAARLRDWLLEEAHRPPSA